jgi:hypothetical protein
VKLRKATKVARSEYVRRIVDVRRSDSDSIGKDRVPTKNSPGRLQYIPTEGISRLEVARPGTPGLIPFVAQFHLSSA